MKFNNWETHQDPSTININLQSCVCGNLLPSVICIYTSTIYIYTTMLYSHQIQCISIATDTADTSYWFSVPWPTPANKVPNSSSRSSSNLFPIKEHDLLAANIDAEDLTDAHGFLYSSGVREMKDSTWERLGERAGGERALKSAWQRAWERFGVGKERLRGRLRGWERGQRLREQLRERLREAKDVGVPQEVPKRIQHVEERRFDIDEIIWFTILTIQKRLLPPTLQA